MRYAENIHPVGLKETTAAGLLALGLGLGLGIEEKSSTDGPQTEFVRPDSPELRQAQQWEAEDAAAEEKEKDAEKAEKVIQDAVDSALMNGIDI